ncbi:hypothetical protein [Rhizobium mongolense]|uniref:Uncharacterized protein n=1 Tax=Rhizobium mongolense TaxID=57676 RepID=A0ABR6IZG5_9HYPH|nr:hypothetical protein [Rhizobium mongolense]MBB4233321.1 hypothetical protein [Rhizobium mongolense]
MIQLSGLPGESPAALIKTGTPFAFEAAMIISRGNVADRLFRPSKQTIAT